MTNINNYLDVIVQITIITAAIGAGFRWIRNWIRKQVVVPLHEAKKQLEPNGGSKDLTRKIVENTNTTVLSMNTSMNDMMRYGVENRILIQELTARLERHIKEGHEKS